MGTTTPESGWPPATLRKVPHIIWGRLYTRNGASAFPRGRAEFAGSQTKCRVSHPKYKTNVAAGYLRPIGSLISIMKRFTCVPKTDEEVVIVTNGDHEQVERTLVLLNERTSNLIPMHTSIRYLRSLNDLVSYLDRQPTTGEPVNYYDGATVFMFFDGVEFIQRFLCQAIDYENLLLVSMARDMDNFSFTKIRNSYFYFDSSISIDYNRVSPATFLSDSYQFNALMAVANDIMKKSSFMLCRVRGILIDDIRADGERVYALSRFVKNLPYVDRVELASASPILMTNMLI